MPRSLPTSVAVYVSVSAEGFFSGPVSNSSLKTFDLFLLFFFHIFSVVKIFDYFLFLLSFYTQTSTVVCMSNPKSRPFTRSRAQFILEIVAAIVGILNKHTNKRHLTSNPPSHNVRDSSSSPSSSPRPRAPHFPLSTLPSQSSTSSNPTVL